MIIVENRDSKKYFVISGRSYFCLGANSGCEIDSDEVRLVRAYSGIRFVDVFLKILFFALALVFVFLETDYENNETLLISLKYKCKAKSEKLSLAILPSPLLNIEKTGEVEGKFTINKYLLIAHLLSVILYAAALTGFILFLGLFAIDEKNVKLAFYILSGVSALVGVVATVKSVIRYKKTLKYLHGYYDNYIY